MYIAIDGDEIGKKLERLLFTDNLVQASELSHHITNELIRITNYFEALNCTIRFAGGDSIVIEAPNNLDIEISELSRNGLTWSVGIGNSPSKAALALKKAKALGRNRIETLED